MLQQRPVGLAASNDVLHSRTAFTASADGIAASADEIPAFADSLAASADSLAASADGIAALADGIAAFADGIAALADGIAALADGIAALADGIAALADGIAALADGIAAFADGVVTSADGRCSLVCAWQQRRCSAAARIPEGPFIPSLSTHQLCVCALQVEGRGVGVNTNATSRPSPVAVQVPAGVGGRQYCSCYKGEYGDGLGLSRCVLYLLGLVSLPPSSSSLLLLSLHISHSRICHSLFSVFSAFLSTHHYSCSSSPVSPSPPFPAHHQVTQHQAVLGGRQSSLLLLSLHAFHARICHTHFIVFCDFLPTHHYSYPSSPVPPSPPFCARHQVTQNEAKSAADVAEKQTGSSSCSSRTSGCSGGGWRVEGRYGVVIPSSFSSPSPLLRADGGSTGAMAGERRPASHSPPPLFHFPPLAAAPFLDRSGVPPPFNPPLPLPSSLRHHGALHSCESTGRRLWFASALATSGVGFESWAGSNFSLPHLDSQVTAPGGAVLEREWAVCSSYCCQVRMGWAGWVWW
ncbi:unnamed protein product [Closterium sp. NIES-54]